MSARIWCIQLHQPASKGPESWCEGWDWGQGCWAGRRAVPIARPPMNQCVLVNLQRGAGSAFISEHRALPVGKEAETQLYLCLTWVPRVGAVEGSALFMAVCMTECVTVLCVCILCLCVSGICAQLRYWVSLQTMAAVIRQMLLSLCTREGGQENPESARVIVRSIRGQCAQGCSDNSLLRWDGCFVTSSPLRSWNPVDH